MDFTEIVLNKNPESAPMCECHYYLWLSQNVVDCDIHAFQTKSEYLKQSFGFVKGEDRLSREAIQTLKYIEKYYFDTKFIGG